MTTQGGDDTTYWWVCPKCEGTSVYATHEVSTCTYVEQGTKEGLLPPAELTEVDEFDYLRLVGYGCVECGAEDITPQAVPGDDNGPFYQGEQAIKRMVLSMGGVWKDE